MGCPFCTLKKDYRTIYEDPVVFASLEEEQSVRGYTLVILKSHYDTILDQDIPTTELIYFWRKVQEIGNAIKESFGAENVYVCTLCDGIKHFHVHLIPRYKWTDDDKRRYSDLFVERDGPASILTCTQNGTIGGFWWLADAERNYKDTPFMQKSEDERHKILSETAEKICQSMK